MLNNDHRRILTAVKSGLQLKWMKPTGNIFNDGFALVGSGNNLTGFREVKTSNVIYLEKHGYLILNRYHVYKVTGKFKGE